MLEVVLVLDDGRKVELPPVTPGRGGSFTDYTNPQREIVILSCTDKEGKIQVSRKGITIEEGIMRAISSEDLITEKIIQRGETYKRPITIKQRKGTLIFIYT